MQQAEAGFLATSHQHIYVMLSAAVTPSSASAAHFMGLGDIVGMRHGGAILWKDTEKLLNAAVSEARMRQRRGQMRGPVAGDNE